MPRHGDHDDRDSDLQTLWLEGSGVVTLELGELNNVIYDVQNAPGYPSGSNSQDVNEVRLELERVDKGENARATVKWIGTITWNVTVPYIVTYRV